MFPKVARVVLGVRDGADTHVYMQYKTRYKTGGAID